MAKQATVQKANPNFLDGLRDAIVECGLSKQAQEHTIRELESIGASALAINKMHGALKKLRKQITESKEYKLEKQLKAQLKQIAKAQETKTDRVLGVIEAHNPGKQFKGFNEIAGLLESGGK